MRLKSSFVRRANTLLSLLVLGGLAVLAYVLTDPLPETVAGRARVMDGDSVRIGENEIRLQGIDAPEFEQDCRRNGQAWPCGRAARDALRELARQSWTCTVNARDQYDRLLANCVSRSGENINALMVERGWAVDFGGYAREEAKAARARSGLWSGSFDRPQDWRDARRR